MTLEEWNSCKIGDYLLYNSTGMTTTAVVKIKQIGEKVFFCTLIHSNQIHPGGKFWVARSRQNYTKINYNETISSLIYE